MSIPSYVAKNIIISLDFDGVLAHGLNAKKKYAKKWFGLSLSLSQTKKDAFEDFARKEGLNINYRSLMDPLNEKHIMEYEVPENCIPILKKLHSQGFRFVIITSRNDHDYPYAKKFVKKRFGKLIRHIHNTRNKPKTEFIKKLKPRIHIDDDLKKLHHISGECLDLCYYRQPENYHEDLIDDAGRITEIRSWREFYDFCHHQKLLYEAICWKYNLKNNVFKNNLIFNHLKRIPEASQKKLIQEYVFFQKKA
ncbi:MAG: 5' nucleotidase, NT5C type [Nanobdellota archaeon]